MRAETMIQDSLEFDKFSPVKSSNLAGVGVIGENLYIFFLSGPVHLYPGAAGYFLPLKEASSAGTFFSKNLRKRYNLRICKNPTCINPANSDILPGPNRLCPECMDKKTRALADDRTSSGDPE